MMFGLITKRIASNIRKGRGRVKVMIEVCTGFEAIPVLIPTE